MGGRILIFGGGVALAAWCGWVSGFHTDSAAAILTWSISLLFVVAADALLLRAARSGRFAWLRPAEPWPRPERGGAAAALRGLSPWLVLLLVAVTWDVLGIDTGPRLNHLTISALAQAFRSINGGLLLLWILLGVGYGVARARVPYGAPLQQNPGGGFACLALTPLAVHREEPALLLPSSRTVGIVFWAVVGLAALVIDQVGRRSGGRTATSGELVRFATTGMLGNVLVIVAWLLAGYHLFAR